MYRRYSGEVLELPADEGIRLLLYALEKEDDDKLFTLWVASKQCFERSFDEFKASLKPAVVDEKETLAKIDRWMETTEWVKG